MQIHHLYLGELKSNCYIIETEPGRCVAVDIGGDSYKLLDMLENKKLKLTKILLTHGHFDHTGGVAEVADATGAEVFIHEADSYMLASEKASLAADISVLPFKPVTKYTAIGDDCYIRDGDCYFRVMHTPGHSPGSVCYICNNIIFSGDTLFCCSIGRTDFAGGNIINLENSLKRIAGLSGDYRLYPGHNQTSTLDFERKNNPYLRSAARI